MKTIPLIVFVTLVFCTGLAAQNADFAIGTGVESTNPADGAFEAQFRGTMLMDLGFRLLGPVFLGAEFQAGLHSNSVAATGALAEKVDTSFSDRAYGPWIADGSLQKTLQVTTFFLSPRLTASLDLSPGFQLLGYVGLSKPLIHYAYSLKVAKAGTTIDGETYTADTSLDYFKYAGDWGAAWELLEGARLSWGLFFVEYTHYLSGAGADRFGTGVNLRL